MKRKRKKKRYQKHAALDGQLWLQLNVQELATNPEFRAVVRRHLFSGADWKAPRSKGRNRNLQLPMRMDRIYEPVRATIEIDAYLTDEVPERLRKRTYTVRCEGDALVRAADMFRRIYEENEKRGGDPALATAADVDKRITKRRRGRRVPRKGKKRFVLRNRGPEPYVWGHDLSDLVFERIYVNWKNPRECRITFGIGS